jgi:hypothetical protein
MWKFLCTSETEKECLIRQLFGNHKMVDEIEEGDILFLHNRDSDVLMGPFKAATESTMRIVDHAWDGRFPFQVYVTWEEPVYQISISRVADPSCTENPISLPVRDGFQALSEANTEKFLKTLRNHELSEKIICKR